MYLQGVVALDVLEAVCPRAGLGRIGDRRAGHSTRSVYSRQTDDQGIDLRRVVVVEVGAVAGSGYGGIGRVLIGPGGVAARGMDDSEDRVGPDEVPRKDRGAALGGVAGQA